MNTPCILFCGFIVSIWISTGAAHELDKLLNVKMPQAELASAFMPEKKSVPDQGPVQKKKPDREASEKGWFLRLLEGSLLGYAVYHTQQESDGRPVPPGSSR